jgi:hypothetical protein
LIINGNGAIVNLRAAIDVLLVLVAPKCVTEPRQHQRSRVVYAGYAVQLPPLKVSNRFQHPTAARRSASPGIRLNQFARPASYRVTERTGWTLLGQSKNELKAFKQRPVRPVQPRSAPVVRRRLDSRCTPRVIGAAPEHLATLVTHDVAWAEGPVNRRSVPRDRMTAGAVEEISEPTA